MLSLLGCLDDNLDSYTFVSNMMSLVLCGPGSITYVSSINYILVYETKFWYIIYYFTVKLHLCD